MAKRRLAIYHFFEESGYVDKYVEHLLREIDSICSRLIIVVNGELQESGREIFRKYTNDLLFRENVGFDGAAYKDAIRDYGGGQQYDEILLCNNSFFGPFVDLLTLFSIAELHECDFWGLSYRNSGIAAFIESYFLVFRENILKSNALWEYFEQLPDIRTYRDVRIFFEIGIFQFLHERGFKHGSLALRRNYESNIKFPYETIIYDKVPILKKKAFYHDNMSSMSLRKAIAYIQQNHKEWAGHISAWVQRAGIVIQNEDVCVKGEITPQSDCISCVTIQDVQNWINKFRHIYLFGNGLYSQLLIRLYGILPQGIIISDELWTEGQYNGIAIIKRSLFDFEQNDNGIIISVGRKSSEEIYHSVGKRNNILYIWGDVT